MSEYTENEKEAISIVDLRMDEFIVLIKDLQRALKSDDGLIRQGAFDMSASMCRIMDIILELQRDSIDFGALLAVHQEKENVLRLIKDKLEIQDDDTFNSFKKEVEESVESIISKYQSECSVKH